MHRQKSRDQVSFFEPSPWSGIVYRVSRQWKIPVLVVSLGAFQPVFAWSGPTDAAVGGNVGPKSSTSAVVDSVEKQSLRDLERLEKTASRVLSTEIEAGELRQDVLNEVEEVRGQAQRTILFKRLTRLFSSDADSTSAREAALLIDQGDLLERVRGMVILADAERSQKKTTEAWWSLREAQQLALQLENSEDVVAIFREIGTVERKIRATDGSNESKLDHAPDDVISHVLNHGLPPKGYQEIEFLRDGGGPLREPAVFRHSYYYDGDRYFQGPNFAGGDTRVQLTHPRTGCEISIPIKMPAGAPIIVHDDREIEYLFPAVTVEIKFRNSGSYEVDFDDRDWKYTFLRKRLERQAVAGNPLLNGGNHAMNSLKAAAQRGLAGPTAIGRQLPIISGLLDRASSRISGTLSAPSP